MLNKNCTPLYLLIYTNRTYFFEIKAFLFLSVLKTERTLLNLPELFYEIDAEEASNRNVVNI